MQASETRMLRTSSPRRRRRALARAHAGLGDAPRHVAGAQQVLVVGVEERHVVARGLGQAQQILVARARPRRASERRHSCSSQRPMTLRSRRVVPSTPRSLERLKRPRVVVEHRLVELEAEQRPGAAREHGGAAVAQRARRRRPRPCRAPRRRTPARRRGRGGAAASRRSSPGSTSSPKMPRRQPEALDQAVGPAPAARVEEAGRRRGRRLVGDARRRASSRSGRARARSARRRRGSRRPPRRAAGRPC